MVSHVEKIGAAALQAPVERLLPEGGNEDDVPTKQAGGGVAWAAQQGGGSTTFTGLTDTPGTIAATQYVRGNSGGTALEFVAGDPGAADASTTNYTGEGTGASTRTVKSKMDDWVSVKDFGATGNNSADDLAACQAAANYVATLAGNSGGMLYFPAGNYRFSAPLVLDGDVSVCGAGGKGTTIRPHGTFPATTVQSAHTFHAPLIYIVGGSGGSNAMSISDFRIDCESNAPVGLSITTGSNYSFSNLRIQGCTQDGLVLDGQQNSVLYNCTIFGCGRDNLRLINGAKWITILSCFNRNATRAGVHIEGDDVTYPGQGIFPQCVNVTQVGGIIEGGPKQWSLKIADGLRHRFYNVYFFSENTTAFVENSVSEVVFDACGWQGADLVPALISSGVHTAVLDPHLQNLVPTGNLFHCTGGDLTVVRPRLSSVTAGGKILGAAGGSVFYEDRFKSGSTPPDMSQIDAVGMQFFDTDIGRPVWWNGTAWADLIVA